MNLLGKVFTVLILLMSVSFLMLAVVVYATHTNWKKLVDNASPGAGEKLGYVQQVREKDALIERLRGEQSRLKNALAREQAARRYALAALQSKLTNVDTALESEQKKAEESLTRATEQAAELKVALNEVDRLAKEVNQLRTDVLSAKKDRDEAFNDIVFLATSHVVQLRDSPFNLLPMFPGQFG